MIEVSIQLKSLAHAFLTAGHPLYLVGGYVRNSLLGISVNDIDIASSLEAKEVINLCRQAGFKAQIVNKNLGTVLITKKDEQYEYTAFRKEVYDESGKHKPEAVEFVNDPKEDAIRRDFTVNAFYYDIFNEKLYDYFNGQKDLNKKLLRTVTKPEVVFNDDGLRILRLIRFVAELGFVPESKTLKTAKKLSYKVEDISKERILKEIKTSINGGLKYHLKNQTHGNVIKYYNYLNLWQYIFSPQFKNFAVKPSGKFYKAYLKSDGNNRYIAFMCLVFSNFISLTTNDDNIFFTVQQMLGLNGLKDSNKNIQDIFDAFTFAKKLLTLNDVELTNNRTCLKFEKLSFEVKNYLSLINADKVNKIRLQIMKMKKTKVPFTENDLDISVEDLQNKVKVQAKHISKVKQALFNLCVDGTIINDRYILIEQAIHFYEKFLIELFNEKRSELNKPQVFTDIMKTEDVTLETDNYDVAEQTESVTEQPIENNEETQEIENTQTIVNEENFEQENIFNLSAENEQVEDKTLELQKQKEQLLAEKQRKLELKQQKEQKLQEKLERKLERKQEKLKQKQERQELIKKHKEEKKGLNIKVSSVEEENVDNEKTEKENKLLKEILKYNEKLAREEIEQKFVVNNVKDDNEEDENNNSGDETVVVVNEEDIKPIETKSKDKKSKKEKVSSGFVEVIQNATKAQNPYDKLIQPDVRPKSNKKKKGKTIIEDTNTTFEEF